VFIPLSVIVIIAIGHFGGPLDESVKAEATEWFHLIAPCIFMIVLFQRIGWHIKDTVEDDGTNRLV
jgi:hypothetical protein